MGGGQEKHKKKPRHPLKKRERARLLRSQGYTHREIAQKLGIAYGTAHLWTAGIVLTWAQKQAIQKRRRKAPPWTVEQRKVLGERLKKANTKYSKRDLVNRIREFYKHHGRIPLKKEMGNSRTFRRLYGTWNNAIRAAGFEPNPEFFAKKFKADDGHICDSFAEKIIDDWLSANNIPHQRQWRYPATKFTADFYLEKNNLIVEFFGLKGVNKRYDANIQKKLQIIRKSDLTLLSLFQEDLVKNKFGEKLKEALKTLVH